MDCEPCKFERGCCKKRKLTLAMSSQILDWLKSYQEELNSIITTEQLNFKPARGQQQAITTSNQNFEQPQPATLDLLEQCREELSNIDFYSINDAETTQFLELFQQYDENIKSIEIFSTSDDYKTRILDFHKHFLEQLNSVGNFLISETAADDCLMKCDEQRILVYCRY